MVYGDLDIEGMAPRVIVTAIWSACAFVCASLISLEYKLSSHSLGDTLLHIIIPTALTAFTSFALASLQIRMSRSSPVGTAINFSLVVPATVFLEFFGVLALWSAYLGGIQSASVALLVTPIFLFALPPIPILIVVFGIIGGAISTAYSAKCTSRTRMSGD